MDGDFNLLFLCVFGSVDFHFSCLSPSFNPSSTLVRKAQFLSSVFYFLILRVCPFWSIFDLLTTCFLLP